MKSRIFSGTRVTQIIALLIAALLVVGGPVTSVQAAPKAKAPSWTLSQSTDELGHKLVVLEGILPADSKGEYRFEANVTLGNNCQHLTDCGSLTCEYACPAGLQCNWTGSNLVLFPADKMATEQGAGWAVTGQRTPSGFIFKLTLTNEHFVGRDFIQVSLQGYPKTGFPIVQSSTSIDEGFGSWGY
jgi:hypothetical protein